MENDKKKVGPKPDHLQIEGDWKGAVKKAIEKKRPKEGWPMNDKKYAAQRKKGAELVWDKIRKGSGIPEENMEWDVDPRTNAPAPSIYTLKVAAGGRENVFGFSGAQLADYPKGRPAVDATVAVIIRWIKKPSG